MPLNSLNKGFNSVNDYSCYPLIMTSILLVWFPCVRIVQYVPGCLHAFIGTHESSAAQDTRNHQVGNVG